MIALLVVIAAGLGIVQLWYPLMTAAVFVKVLVTLGVLCAVAGVIGIMRREDTQKQRGFID